MSVYAMNTGTLPMLPMSHCVTGWQACCNSNVTSHMDGTACITVVEMRTSCNVAVLILVW